MFTDGASFRFLMKHISNIPLAVVHDKRIVFAAVSSLYPVNRKLVGRAVTAMYAPARPDYFEASAEIARALGKTGTPNQWVIDSLTDRDVAVVDMYNKVYKGTFIGGNLTTAIKTRTGTGGAVIWGGIRDVEQMQKVPDVQVYYQGIDPTPIRDFVMTGYNMPVRLGDGREAAICLPGDVVYGCCGRRAVHPAAAGDGGGGERREDAGEGHVRL